jgi:alpha-L-fucosidase 2
MTQWDHLKLWYRQPALQWVEALPVGNGRLGAMVFGGVMAERIQLNEDTFWAGGPYDPTHDDALPGLTLVREAINAGDYERAHELTASMLLARPVRQMPYLTPGDLRLTFPHDTFDDYRRSLDLDSAVATTTYRHAGVRFKRQVFASVPDDVIVIHLEADKPSALTFGLSFDSLLPACSTRIEGDTLIAAGNNIAAYDNPGRLRFEARALVVTDGKQSAVDGSVHVHSATTATIYLAIATNFRRYDDISGEPEQRNMQTTDQIRTRILSEVLDDHVAEHRRLFRASSIDLGTSPASALPTDERVANSETLTDPHLSTLYYQFGRYLMISCSRPGGQPANLQGVWNDRLDPPWGCKYTININTEMNYWPVDATNMGECFEPLFKMLEELAVAGRRTARRHYDARGWVCHHNTDLWRASAAIDGPAYGMWQTGGAWLCTHLWDHFDYTQDLDFLRRAHPIVRGAVEFFLDAVVIDPASGHLVTSPSNSPENMHRKRISVCKGPAMDSQILRDLFGQFVASCRLLDIDHDLARQASEVRAKLAPDRIGNAGQLQEWMEDWDMNVPEIHHRHVSHLYAVYPSSQINIHDTPELAAAAKRSLEIRGDNATGWGIGWRINLWARFADAEHTHDVLKMLLSPKRTYPNLFDAHPPFQIDGNFGGVAGIAQTLLQSYSDRVFVLPALPKAWPAGSATGLRARGGFVFDLAWDAGRLTRCQLHSVAGKRCRLIYAGKEHVIDTAAGQSQDVMSIIKG